MNDILLAVTGKQQGKPEDASWVMRAVNRRRKDTIHNQNLRAGRTSSFPPASNNNQGQYK